VSIGRGLTGVICLLAICGSAVTPVAAQDPGTMPAGQRSIAVRQPWETSPDPLNGPTQRVLPKRGAATSETSASSKSTKPTSATLWGTVVAIVLLAGGLMVTLKWLRRHGPAVLRALPDEALEPLGQRVLSRGVAVHLVRCGGRMLLLGVGPDGVRTLAEIHDPVEVDLLAGACRRRDEAQLGMAGFAQLLQRGNSPVRPAHERTSSRMSTATREVDGA
jgi:flagellar biogenesis protein FliO